jgi:Ca2+-binding EF-hand superfamily protein
LQGQGKANAELKELIKIDAQLKDLNVEVDTATVNEKFAKTIHDTTTRRKEFGTLRETLLENEQLCKTFAESAQNFFSFIEVQKEKEKATGEDLETTIKILNEVHSVLEDNGNDKLKELHKIDDQIKSRNIDSNPFTQYTVRSLRNNFESFLAANSKKIEAAHKQLEAKKDTGISTKDYSEFKETFEHFDKDKDDRINAIDLYGVLKVLMGGENITEESAAALLMELDKDGDGLLHWDEFKVYIVNKKSDKGTIESYLEDFRKVAGGKVFVTVSDLAKAGFDQDKIAYFTKTMPVKQGIEGETGYDYVAWLSKN